ncbi:MAG: hypothetical protein M3454_09240 [Actinomycetota bacterium]|nr:hypothetical protein [Actinomycetota bacterium]
MRRVFWALSALLLLLIACGDDPSPSSGEAARSLATASEKTLQEHSSKVSVSVSVDSSDGTLPQGGYRAEGAFDYSTSKGHMSVDLGKLPVAAGSDSGSVEVVFDDSVIYMKLPGLQESLPTSKAWVRIDVKELQRQSDGASQFNAFGQADPSQYLQFLQGAGKVEELGSETVREVETTRYKAVVDLSEAVKQAPAEMRQSVTEAIKASGSKSVPVNAWIDSEGLLRRVRYSYGGVEQTGGLSSSITVDFYDFGTTVEVRPPSEGQVTDLADILEKASP